MLADMLAKRLIDSLYMEAMLMADEVRAYFDENGRDARDALDPIDRVLFSCESLKVTTRLMHIVAWLLAQRAIEAGELSGERTRDSVSRLGDTIDTDLPTLERLPGEARALVEASMDLHSRVGRVEAGLEPTPHSSPARQLLGRLQQSF
jgi:regulator of CtrA degradation